MKKFELALISALIITIAAVALQLPFSLACEEVRADTLRLHIIANSDSDADQAVKLLVRDRVLDAAAPLSAYADDKAEMLAAVEASLSSLELAAKNELRENGFDYEVRAEVCEAYFNERHYDKITLPAGKYTALRIVLGEGKGKNWWCMLYPAVCLSGAVECEPLEGYTDEEAELVTGYTEYEIRFKLEEVFQKLFKKDTAR